MLNPSATDQPTLNVEKLHFQKEKKYVLEKFIINNNKYCMIIKDHRT